VQYGVTAESSNLFLMMLATDENGLDEKLLTNHEQLTCWHVGSLSRLARQLTDYIQQFKVGLHIAKFGVI
jgi:hypothetical protein